MVDIGVGLIERFCDNLANYAGKSSSLIIGSKKNIPPDHVASRSFLADVVAHVATYRYVYVLIRYCLLSSLPFISRLPSCHRVGSAVLSVGRPPRVYYLLPTYISMVLFFTLDF